MSVILLTGITGQVGRELVRSLQPLGRVIALGRQQMDLANPDSIRRATREASPDIIVNAAAYTGVDKAESEPDIAMQVNGIAPGVLAEEAKRRNALLVHYSTDYVFDGLHEAPYEEEDAPNPVNVYGRTKLEGERAIVSVGGTFLILRTSWLYSDQPPNFVLTILELARKNKELRVVDDQVGSPTWAHYLAQGTADLLRQVTQAREHPGIYHLSAFDSTTRYAFARRILELAHEIAPGRTATPLIRPITTAEYPLPARRPLNAATSKEKILRVFGIRLPGWEDQLRCSLVSLLGAESTERPARGRFASP